VHGCTNAAIAAAMELYIPRNPGCMAKSSMVFHESLDFCLVIYKYWCYIGWAHSWCA